LILRIALEPQDKLNSPQPLPKAGMDCIDHGGEIKGSLSLLVHRPVALRNLLLPICRTSNFFNGECFIAFLERGCDEFVQIERRLNLIAISLKLPS